MKRLDHKPTTCPCPDPKCCGVENDPQRTLGDSGELLQNDDGWHLENHDNDDGPVIWHRCGRYTVDLNRRFTMCRHCGVNIPPSMICGFTLLNWNRCHDDEYFVDPLNEVMDFIYNGHLNKQLKGCGDWGMKDEDVDMDPINAAIAAHKEKLT